jgi:hypothetical protein
VISGEGERSVLFLSRLVLVLLTLVGLLGVFGPGRAQAQGVCVADFEPDGHIDVRDLQALATRWRQPASRATGYDMDGSGWVDVRDMLRAVWFFGRNCGPLTDDSPPLFGFAGNHLSSAIVTSNNFQALRPQWVRWGVTWSAIEPQRTEPPTYVWNQLDQHLITLTRSGLRPIGLISNNPGWAATTNCGPHDKLANSTPFVQFIRAVVARYDGDGDYDNDGILDGSPIAAVREWEFYNEPDWNDTGNALVGGCWGRYPVAYAKMLMDIYPVVHATNPKATVVFGGIAAEDIGANPTTNEPYFNFNRNRNSQANDFVKQVLAAGAGRSFDASNFHYFAAFDAYWAPWGKGILGKINWFNERLDAAGVARKPIILTEVGLRSDGSSPELQARFVIKIHARAIAAGVKATSWFTYQDIPPEAWGLVDHTNTPKLAYQSYLQSVNFMSDSEFLSVGTVGGVESYQFRTALGRSLVVAWSEDGMAKPITLTAHRLQLTMHDGQSFTIRDGYQGDADLTTNGQIAIVLDDAPRFLEVLE